MFGTSPGETPIAEAAHVAAHANMWRTVGDFWDSWEQLKELRVAAEATVTNLWTGSQIGQFTTGFAPCIRRRGAGFYRISAHKN